MKIGSFSKVCYAPRDPIKPFSYTENSRVKIIWYVPEPVIDSTYTLEWEPEV